MTTPSMPGNPPHINLSDRQHAALLSALELEEGGYEAAALFLRRRHFPDLPWDEPIAGRPTTREGFERLFRIHHGSVPPTPPREPAAT